MSRVRSDITIWPKYDFGNHAMRLMICYNSTSAERKVHKQSESIGHPGSSTERPATFLQGLGDTSKEALKVLLWGVLRMVRGRLGLRGSLPPPLALLWPPVAVVGGLSGFPSSSSSSPSPSLFSALKKKKRNGLWFRCSCGQRPIILRSPKQIIRMHS